MAGGDGGGGGTGGEGGCCVAQFQDTTHTAVYVNGVPLLLVSQQVTHNDGPGWREAHRYTVPQTAAMHGLPKNLIR